MTLEGGTVRKAIAEDTRWPVDCGTGSKSTGIPARVALVHDWCPAFRGGERVLAALCKITNSQDVFTIFDFLDSETKHNFFPGVNFHTSVANRIPFISKFYRSLFFTCPFLIEQFDVTDYDAVVSSSAAFARGVITRPDQPHLCYIHSPIRYAWDEQFSYLRELGWGPKGALFRYLLHRLRTWDVRTGYGPDVMVANSTFVRSRIRRIYGRDARVIFPPVPLDELIYNSAKENYYVTASFLSPYKRTDLVVSAFSETPNRKLVVVGEGQEMRRLKGLAAKNVEFTGYLPRVKYLDVISRAKAFVFAGCEDFGIGLAEAQGSGTPLIAFGRGGALDIIQQGGRVSAPTGILFSQQSVSAIKDAVDHFEKNSFISSDACRQNAERFSPERFAREIRDALEEAVNVNGQLGHAR